jgi:hypothetical protein
LSTPKASSRTQRACTPVCSPSLSTCSPEYASRRPPHCCYRRAPPSARSPSQPTISAHPLGPSEAARATRWPAPPLSSPEFKCPRSRHHRPVAAARRRHPRSSHHRQSREGEPNCISPSLVCLPRLTSLPASSPLPSGPREGKARAWLWRI